MNNLSYELLENIGLKVFCEQEIRGLFNKKIKRIPVNDWMEDLSFKYSGVSKLLIALEDGAGVEECTSDNSFILSHAFLSKLSAHQASQLGLPPFIPYTMRVELSGPITAKGTTIRHFWQDNLGRRKAVKRDGSLVFVGQLIYIIPEQLFKVIESLEKYNEFENADFDNKMRALSALSPIIGDSKDSVSLDERLSTIKMRHASSFSINLHYVNGDLKLDPVLFSKDILNQVERQGLKPEIEHQMFTEIESQRFVRDCFNKFSDSRPSYLLDKDDYVFIDPVLRESLRVVKTVQQSDQPTKKRFAQSPASFIADYFEKNNIEQPLEQIESLFIETTAFSERVLGLGLWVPPALPIIPRVNNDWVPDTLFLKVGSENLPFSADGLSRLKKDLEEANQKSVESIVVKTPTGNDVHLRTDLATIEAVNQLLGVFRSTPIDPIGNTPKGEGKPKPTIDKTVVQTTNNIDDTHFSKGFKVRGDFNGFEPVHSLKNVLKKHQILGVTWLQETWLKGYPGVLLADDMGLGKTFQTLAFLAWLKLKRQAIGLPRAPFLIVAPVSLLENWNKEARLHVDDGVLGAPLMLYGKNINVYRQRNAPRTGSDVVVGSAVLDTQKIMQSDWILVNYETMRDYQISLSSIKFGAVVFDEMQKVKNPASAMTNASKALNSEYMIGLTGTPIENSMADLWTIMDTLIPGSLGMVSLKEFVEKYNPDKEENLKALRESMMEPSNGNPAPILRRMKYEIADDLPLKREIRVDFDMPEAQAFQYAELVKQGKAKVFSGLELVNKLKMASIHPIRVRDIEEQSFDDYIGQSAKYQALINILDKVKARNVKALIFIEYKEIHEWLAIFLKQRYGLDHLPKRIYGDINASARMNIVNSFQEQNGKFDVLLLSPKAAGVGLTLTEASVVIHFTRWWNPAVEDQCTDRAYRIGQTKDVDVYYPVARHPVFREGSFDYILDNILQTKRELSRQFLIPALREDDVKRLEDALIGNA